jgi:hypothetical protein
MAEASSGDLAGGKALEPKGSSPWLADGGTTGAASPASPDDVDGTDSGPSEEGAKRRRTAEPGPGSYEECLHFARYQV